MLAVVSLAMSSAESAAYRGSPGHVIASSFAAPPLTPHVACWSCGPFCAGQGGERYGVPRDPQRACGGAEQERPREIRENGGQKVDVSPHAMCSCVQREAQIVFLAESGFHSNLGTANFCVLGVATQLCPRYRCACALVMLLAYIQQRLSSFLIGPLTYHSRP